ncbi:diacylglycerol kinase [Plasmodium cynomolgi strain B]|uniref:diacylglycerol kinase (ATP) n=1 Tax=Plasmodium cynomolgi (strain B) TaxID=1120755 RepID=K6V9M3_PLACD|nr:diacylglycerol kinase [Plasmodium cynomolgi strain B]GAB65877.1 diacylglycerol kinase [Plasmodium cynomolgi strain B]
MEDFAYVDKNVYINLLVTIINKCKEYLLGIGILKLLFCLCIVLISIIFARRKNKKKKKINIYIQLHNVRHGNGKKAAELADDQKCCAPNEEAQIVEPTLSQAPEPTDVEQMNNEFYHITYSPHIFDLKSINRTELCNVCNESIYSFIFYKKDIFECVVCRNKCHIECAPNSNLMSCKTTVFFKNKHKFIKIRNCMWNNKCNICSKKFSYFSFPPFVQQYIYKCIWCNKYFHVHCIAKIAKKKNQTHDKKKQVKDAICTYGNNKYVLLPYEVTIKENVLLDFLTNAYHRVNEAGVGNDEVILSYTANALDDTPRDDDGTGELNAHEINEKEKKQEHAKGGNNSSVGGKHTPDEQLCLDYLNHFPMFHKMRKFKSFPNCSKAKNSVIPVHENFLLNFFPIHLPIYEIKSSRKFLLIFVNVKSGGQVGKKLYQELLMYFNPLQIISIKSEKNVLNALNMYKEMICLNRVIILLCGGDGTISIFIDTLLKFFANEVAMDALQGKNKGKYYKLYRSDKKSEHFVSTKSTFLNKTIMNITAKLKHNKDALRKKWANNITAQAKKPTTFFLKKRSEKNADGEDADHCGDDDDAGHISEENAETYFGNDSCTAHVWGENQSDELAPKLTSKVKGTFAGGRRIDDPSALNGELKGDLIGQLSSELMGQLSGELSGNLNGELSGNLNGDLNDDLRQHLSNDLNSEINDWSSGRSSPKDMTRRGTEAKCGNGKYLYILEKLRNFKKKGTEKDDDGENTGELCEDEAYKGSTVKSFQNGNSMMDKYYNSNTLIYSNYTENNEDPYSESRRGKENEKMYDNILYHDYKEKATNYLPMKTKLNENSPSYCQEANVANPSDEPDGTLGTNPNKADNKLHSGNGTSLNYSNGNSLNSGSADCDGETPVYVCNGDDVTPHQGGYSGGSPGDYQMDVKGKTTLTDGLSKLEAENPNPSDENIIFQIDNGYKVVHSKEKKKTDQGDHPSCEQKEIINNVIKGEDKEKRSHKSSLESYIACAPIGILPLGTGNDLSYSLGWGCGYNNDPLVYLNKMKSTKNEYIDVWNMKAYDINNNLILNNSFINYFDFGIISRLALHFDNIRKKFPHFFNSRIGNKILYGEVGFRDFCFNTYKYKLNKNIKLYCDGKKVKIDEDIESVCLINIPYFLGGIKIWKDDDKDKHYHSDIDNRQKQEHVRRRTSKKKMKEQVDGNKSANTSSNSSFIGCSMNDNLHNGNNGGVLSNSFGGGTGHPFDDNKKMGMAEFLKSAALKHSAGEDVNPSEFFQNEKTNGIIPSHSEGVNHPQGEENASPPTNEQPFDYSNIYKSYRLDFYRQKKRKQKYRKQKMDDKVIEVIGFRNIFHIFQVQIGMSSAIKLCQGSDIKVKIDKTFIQNKNKIYFQYDGEPGFLNIHKLHFTHKCQYLFLSPKDPI